MKILLTTCNAKFIHKSLALRWLYTTCPHQDDVVLKEFTIRDSVESIVKNIMDMKVDIICFSCYIWNVELMKEIVTQLKKGNTGLKVLIGGPEVSFDSLHFLDENIDAICIGEGEKAVWEYIYGAENAQVNGIATKQNPETLYQRVDLTWLQQFPDPYFLDFDLVNMQHQYLYLETSRGCPYGCTYCLSSTDRNVRFFDEDYIFMLLNKLKDSKVKQVKLLDRTFNSMPERALRIARFMNEKCLKQTFQFEIVADTFTDELLNYFCEEADSSRFRFEIGVQSFNQDTLKAVGRTQHSERLKYVIQQLQNAGFTLHVDLIAALPLEDYTSFAHSFDILFSYNVKELQLGMLKLLKGTKLRYQKAEFGYEMDNKAPYNVKSSKWLTSSEVMNLDLCAHAVEKIYNRGICNESIKRLLEDGFYQSAFELFMNLGVEFNKLVHPYQKKDVYKLLLKVLSKYDSETILGLVNMEYYKKSKQRPPRLTHITINNELRDQLVASFIKQSVHNEYDIHVYGNLEFGYLRKEKGYQMLIYNRFQTYPKQYFTKDYMHKWEEVI